MRFTNLCSTNFVSLYLIQDSPEAQNPNTDNVGSGDESLFKLDAGKSMVFSNAQFQGTDYYDYAVEGYVDIQYFSSFSSLSSIKAKADTARCSDRVFCSIFLIFITKLNLIKNGINIQNRLRW